MQDNAIAEQEVLMSNTPTRTRPNRFSHEHKPIIAAVIRAKIKETGLSPAVFWEQAAIGATVMSVVHLPAFREAAADLGRIGSNIFQILKEVRFCEYDPRRETLELMLGEIIEVKMKINFVLELT